MRQEEQVSLLRARAVKARADLVAFARQFTLLWPSSGQFVGLCPLHRERRPSFYVHPEKQVVHCFGCSAGGDVFAFVMGVMGCDFRHALEIIAECLGVARGFERAYRR